MKHLLLVFLSAVAIGSQAQGWQALGLTAINNETSTCLGTHQGVLYASNLTGGLRKSYDNGTSWTPIPVNGVAGQIKGFTSTGSRLYMFSEDGSASGYIYWSTDEGATWTADTTGMPPHAWIPGGHGNVGELHGYNGRLALICAGGDAYYVKAETDAAWQPVPWLAANDPGSFWSMGDTLMMHGGGAQSQGFAYTTDHGQSWVTPECVGLPDWYSGAVLKHDPLTGRIYSVGGSSIVIGPNLHYSDDLGATWTQIDLTSFLTIGASVWEFTHQVLDLHVHGPHIWLSCTNGQINTRPDLFHSSDGGATFVRDTVGLPEDPFGTYVMHDLMEKDGYVFAVANFNDVFRRELGPVGIADRTPSLALRMWPDPVSDRLFLAGEAITGARYLVRDAMGRPVLQGTLGQDHGIAVQALANGTYTVQLLDVAGRHSAQRFVKN
ncbi:MAG: hypothetical protein U0U25_10415 [Flavobacteriales bacterium]